MEYRIGKGGKGLFLIDEDDVDIVVAPTLGDRLAILASPLMKLKSIKTYLTQQGTNIDPEARQDYERRLQDFRSRVQPLLSGHFERNPLNLEQVTQEQIREAYNKKDDGFLLSLSYGLLV